MPTSNDTSDRAPLSEPVLHILLALVDRPRHGYAILGEVERQAPGFRLGTGTLYTALKRLHADGLVKTVPAPAGESGDARRCYYAVTTEGLAAVRAESARFLQVVRHAQARQILPALGEAGTP